MRRALTLILGVPSSGSSRPSSSLRRARMIRPPRRHHRNRRAADHHDGGQPRPRPPRRRRRGPDRRRLGPVRRGRARQRCALQGQATGPGGDGDAGVNDDRVDISGPCDRTRPSSVKSDRDDAATMSATTTVVARRRLRRRRRSDSGPSTAATTRSSGDDRGGDSGSAAAATVAAFARGRVTNPTPARLPSTEMAGRRTILMVEDETSITEPLARSTRPRGLRRARGRHRGRRARGGTSELPDLVLLDVMLPDGSGYEVARALRERSKVPIIMLTARGEETDRIVGLELGADDYIVKPFSAREVAAGSAPCSRRVTFGAPPGPPSAGRRSKSARFSSTRRAAARPRTADRRSTSPARSSSCSSCSCARPARVISRERLIDEVWDTNWFGSTKTLDVHVSASAASSATTRRTPASSTPSAAWASGSPPPTRLMSLRARLVVAFAYVLVLVIVALEVPLAAQPVEAGRCRDQERGPPAQPSCVAAGAAGRLRNHAQLAPAGRSDSDQPRRPRASWSTSDGAVLADSAGPGHEGRRLRHAAARRSAQRSRAAPPRVSATATLLDEDLLFTAVPVGALRRADPSARCA